MEYRTAIVTGASRGLGRAIAERLRARGLTVVGIARSAGEIQADLRRPEEIRRAFAEARERFGPADVLVNNAGSGSFKPFLEWTDDEIAATVDLNLTSLMLCARAVLPDMLQRGHGLIVNIGSDLSRRFLPNMAPYTASKWGVLGFSGSLLREVKDSGVKVCAVLPGAIATHFGGGTPEVPEDGTLLTADDVAAAIEALLDQPENAVVDELIVHPLRQAEY